MLNNVQLNSSNIHKEHVLRCTIHTHYRVICCSSMITTTVNKSDKYINTTCYNVALVEAIYFDVHMTHECKCPYNIIQIVAGTQYTIHIYNMVNKYTFTVKYIIPDNVCHVLFMSHVLQWYCIRPYTYNTVTTNVHMKHICIETTIITHALLTM